MHSFTTSLIAQYILQNRDDVDFDQAFMCVDGHTTEPFYDAEWMRGQIGASNTSKYRVSNGHLWFQINVGEMANFKITLVYVPWSEDGIAQMRKMRLRRTFEEMSAGYRVSAGEQRKRLR
jgi:hypothetical protein